MAEACTASVSDSSIVRFCVRFRICRLGDLSRVYVREICPQDKPLLIDFHTRLSEQTVHQRYFRHVPLSRRIALDEMDRLCSRGQRTGYALIATRQCKDTDAEEMIGLAELCIEHDHSAEWGVLVCDGYQNLGLGKELCKELLDLSVELGLKTITLYMLPENQPIISIARKLGFRLQLDFDEGVMRAELDLDRPRCCEGAACEGVHSLARNSADSLVGDGAAQRSRDLQRMQAWAGQSEGLGEAEPAADLVRDLWEGAQAVLE